MSCPVVRLREHRRRDECENCGADLRTADMPAAGDLRSRPAPRRAPRCSRGRRPPLIVPPTRPSATRSHRCTTRAGLRARRRWRAPRRDLHRARRGPEAGRPATGRHGRRDVMTPDPVVLREDDPSRWRSTRWPSAASATSRSSRTAGLRHRRPRATSSTTSSRSSADSGPRAPGRDPRRRPDLGDPPCRARPGKPAPIPRRAVQRRVRGALAAPSARSST